MVVLHLRLRKAKGHTMPSAPAAPTEGGAASGPSGHATTPGGATSNSPDRAGSPAATVVADPHSCAVSPVLADLVAPAAVEVFRDALRVDDEWLRVLTVTAYPRYVYPGWLDALIDLDEPFDLALHIHPLETPPMVRALTHRLVQLHSSRLLDQRRGRLADPEREVAYADVERLRDALQRGDERVFSLSLYLLARGGTRKDLDERCARLVATLDNLQIQSRPATLEHDLGLTSCLPEARDRLLRYRNFDTSSLATTFPFTSSSLSMASGVLYGIVPTNGSLVILDPFAHELENANQVVFAKSGAGKSYACKLQALRSLLLGTEVVVVDPEDEYRPLCEAVGGQYIRLAPGSGHHLNPFDLPPALPVRSRRPMPHTARSIERRGNVDASDATESVARGEQDGTGDSSRREASAMSGGAIGNSTSEAEEPTEADEPGEVAEVGESGDLGDVLAEKVQSLHALLDLMLADRGPSGATSLSQREKGLLDRCLYETYRRMGITADRRTHDRPAPLLRDLYDVLTSGVCGADEYGLADRLHRYVDGSLARLFSAPTNVALDRPFIAFDVSDLDGELRPLGLLLITDFVWTRVRRSRRPRLLLIDEAWTLIQHAEGGRFLAGLARRARKHFLGLVTITQDVEDFLGSEWGRTVLANSSIQLLMKQDSTTIEAVSRAFRLSGGERQYLLGCHKGEGLLFARGAHVGLRVEASPAEHAIVTTDPRELAEREREREREHESATVSGSDAAIRSGMRSSDAHESANDDGARGFDAGRSASSPRAVPAPLSPPPSRNSHQRSRTRHVRPVAGEASAAEASAAEAPARETKLTASPLLFPVTADVIHEAHYPSGERGVMSDGRNRGIVQLPDRRRDAAEDGEAQP